MSKYVLHNLNLVSPYPGNLMNSLFTLEKEMIIKNIRNVYLFPEAAKTIDWVQEMIKDGKVVCFKPDKKFQYKIFMDIILKYNIELVHTHFWDLNACLALRIIKLKKRKLRTIIHHHSTYTQSKSKFREFIKRIIIKSDANIGCGKNLTKKLEAMKFNEVYCVENSVDFSRLDSYETLNKENFGIDKDKKVFLMFGYDGYIKGIDLAINALKDIAKKYNIVLSIVFSINAEKGREEIKEQLGEIPDWIKFLPPRKDIASYYHISDVFVSASRQEGFCCSVLESVYCKRHTIISNIGGHAVDIPGISIFESENIEDLKSKIIEYLEFGTDDRTLELKKSYVVEKYGLDSWCKKILSVYNDVLGGNDA